MQVTLPRPELYLALVLSLCGATYAFKSFQERIPNGDFIPHPCWPNYLWYGVGHKNREGGGAKNPFGDDFAANGFKWDKCLCKQDSDGDGRTNGEELGDPDCVWEEGKLPAKKSFSHPGVCEPLDDPMCVEKNDWDLCTAVEFECKYLNTTTDVRELDVRFPEGSRVPRQETTYSCMTFAVPDDDEFHLIAYEPLIDNAHVMHHILLYGCVDPEMRVDSRASECGMSEELCRQLIAIWTVGYLGMCMDDSYGYRIGQGGFKRVMMQIHWNNPQLESNYKDSSGLRLYYTTDLRPNDAGTMMLGQMQLFIPPGQAEVVAEGTCDQKCTRALNGSIFLATGLFHMHYMGTSGYVRHSRGSTDFGYLIEDDVYSYDKPTMHVYDNPVEFKAGDSLNIKCVYQSKSQTDVVEYGDGTSEEMCFAFFTYYPVSEYFHECNNYGAGQFCPTYESEFDEILGDCVLDDWFENAATNMTMALLKACGQTKCTADCQALIEKIRREDVCLVPSAAEFVEPVVMEHAPEYFKEGVRLLHKCDEEIYTREGDNNTPKDGDKYKEVEGIDCPFDTSAVAAVGFRTSWITVFATVGVMFAWL